MEYSQADPVLIKEPINLAEVTINVKFPIIFSATIEAKFATESSSCSAISFVN